PDLAQDADAGAPDRHRGCALEERGSGARRTRRGGCLRAGRAARPAARRQGGDDRRSPCDHQAHRQYAARPASRIGPRRRRGQARRGLGAGRVLERLYARLQDEYELKERAEALSRKLRLIAETAEVLTDIIDTKRSLRLEVIIVVLIAVELAIAGYHIFW